ncbi:MAG: hypothetical protein KF857_07895 [Fimbriimonadaceae bacterium]|nr:hypothetical protein [Fimbriimonadaceae bacterium]
MIWLYNLLLTFLSPLWVPWMLWRTSRRKEPVDWKQRSGEYQLTLREGSERVWLHAVSVGEVIAAKPVLAELRRLRPDIEVLVSVTTSSGHKTATDGLQGLADHVVYFPMDVMRFVVAAVHRFKPRVVAVMETELWLNFLWASRNVGARTMVLNGRISDRAYRLDRLAKPYFKALFGEVDQVMAQSEADAGRFRSLGAADVVVVGNCKFDEAIGGLDADPVTWKATLGIPAEAQVVVVGSTRGEDEERLVVEALADHRLGQVWVVHAPRHLERVPDLASSVASRLGSVALRSKGESGRYLLLDTYGELASVYSLADVVVIGGGFGDYGGQNIIQPLAHGKPVLHGPHMQNFRDVARLAGETGSSRVCADAASLAEALVEILADTALRLQMGQSARDLVRANAGAAARYAKAVAEALG